MIAALYSATYRMAPSLTSGISLLASLRSATPLARLLHPKGPKTGSMIGFCICAYADWSSQHVLSPERSNPFTGTSLPSVLTTVPAEDNWIDFMHPFPQFAPSKGPSAALPVSTPSACSGAGIREANQLTSEHKMLSPAQHLSSSCRHVSALRPRSACIEARRRSPHLAPAKASNGFSSLSHREDLMIPPEEGRRLQEVSAKSQQSGNGRDSKILEHGSRI